MKPSFLLIAIIIVLVPGALAQEVRPFATEETLHYAVNWPSGLSLGEASMSATHAKGGEGTPPRWTFEFQLEAAVPGVTIADEFLATATDELCSLEFEKNLKHGEREARERITFHQSSGTATRETLEGGGSSEVPIGDCAKDAVTFLYHLRDELSRGRIPSSQ
ncbi:MAG: DUF3108 domain-containing protein, partial [bacterium]|nr:DUF3108 domain-containing protein [bacterium]